MTVVVVVICDCCLCCWTARKKKLCMLNRPFLKPFISLPPDQTSLLEFLHILTTNHKLVFAQGNNESDFVAGVCHWLLVMGTHKTPDSTEPKVTVNSEQGLMRRLLSDIRVDLVK